MSSTEKNYSFGDHLDNDSKTVLQSLKNLYEVEEEIQLDFGLEVFEISEAEDNEIENVEDDVDIIVINDFVSLFSSCFHLILKEMENS
jgi:hypothetical protein